MKADDRLAISYMCLIAAIGMIALLSYMNLQTTNKLIDYIDKEAPITFGASQYVVGCETDSMGLILGCNDRLYGKKPVELAPGLIYTYDKPNGTNVVHRLALCVTSQDGEVVNDPTCSDKLVFRGDNNAAGELVNRSQLRDEITQVEYR